MGKLSALLKKHRQLLIYVVFGTLTTLVNYAVYLPLYNLFGISATASNVVAWVFSVTFAFITNKWIVFESKMWSADVILSELWKFLGCRFGSGLIETALLFLCVDMLGWNGNFLKFVTSMLVMVINYTGSKLFVFKRK